MSACEEIKEMLSSYLDNEIHENNRKKVVKHLETCGECKQELENLKNVIDHVNQIDDIDLPKDYNDKLHDKLVETKKEMNPLKWYDNKNFVKIASTFVACFIVFLIAINGSYFKQLFNLSEIAYINDKNLSTVDKEENAYISTTEEDSNNFNKTSSKRKASDSTIMKNDELSDANTSQESLKSEPSQDTTSKQSLPNDKKVNDNKNNTKDKNLNDSGVTITSKPKLENTDDNTTTHKKEKDENNEKDMGLYSTESYPQPISDITLMSLLVDEHTHSISKIINIVQSNGGTIQETAMIKSSNKNDNKRNFIITISKDSYDKVMSSLKKVGIVKNITHESSNISSESQLEQEKIKDDSTEQSVKEVTIKLTVINKSFLQ